MKDFDAEPARFTSRLAAVLVADAVGYSRLMSHDTERTVRTLDAARAVFQAQVHFHHGRVIDMAGDSIMAVFETAIGAMNAATTAQRQIAASNQGLPPERAMLFRVGVNMGDLIEKPDGTAYGDGINIAARLEKLAAPGDIVISDAIYAAVRGKLPLMFTDHGEHLVKNIEYPVRCYKVADTCGYIVNGRTSRAKHHSHRHTGTRTAEQTLHCRAAPEQHEWGPRAGLLQRRHFRRHHH